MELQTEYDIVHVSFMQKEKKPGPKTLNSSIFMRNWDFKNKINQKLTVKNIFLPVGKVPVAIGHTHHTIHYWIGPYEEAADFVAMDHTFDLAPFDPHHSW